MGSFSLLPAHVKSVTSTPLAGSHLLGFFTSFNTEASAADNGNSDLSIYEFNFNGSAAPADQAGGQPVINCLQLTGSCSSPQLLKTFSFCLADGSRSAQITISSAGGIGASTKLDYVPC